MPGFARTASTVSEDQQRYFGRTSVWQRVTLRESDPRTGAVPGGREIVVDVISTPRPQVLGLYPVVTTYPMGTLSSTPDAEVDLGHGVAGQLFRGEDARRGLRTPCSRSPGACPWTWPSPAGTPARPRS